MKKIDFKELVYQFHQDMLANKFTLVYEGEITHQITKAFTTLAENKMDSYSEDASVKKKVFHVMVECLQNLSKHAEDLKILRNNGYSGSGIFIIGKVGEDDEDYHVLTGNVVKKTRVPELEAFLDKINSLDKDGLKELYKKQMREGTLSDKGGAGLGLIDIARKTGEKLEYNFIDIDNVNAFYTLRTKISKK
ncbi:MAG: SiaB family protein kinase [Bacteroidales bacterium]